MSDQTVEGEGAQPGLNRRALVQRMAVGAFAMPAIISFQLDSLARAGTFKGKKHPKHPKQDCPNQTEPNQTWPNQTEPNQTWPNQTHPNQTKPPCDDKKHKGKKKPPPKHKPPKHHKRKKKRGA